MLRVLHQASCVAIGAGDGEPRAVLIEGPPGSGKSSLALGLIDRGGVLVGDDGVWLETRGGRLWATPPPNIAGLLEVRNVGLVTCPVTEGRVALVIALDPAAPRLPEEVARVERAGREVPLIALDPRMPLLVLRAEQALAIHGLG